MAILSTASNRTNSTSPATRVLFDSAEFYNYAVDFGTELQPPRMTLAEELAYWAEVTAKRKAELDAEEVAFQQRQAETRAHLAELDRKYGPLQAKATPRDFALDGQAWEPRPAVVAETIEAQAEETARAGRMDAWRPSRKGYDAQDLADFAAGRLLTADELADRQEAEDEARLLANCPAEVHEEMLAGELARPFEA